MSKRVKLTEEQRKANTKKRRRAYYIANKEHERKSQNEYKKSLNHSVTLVYVIPNYDGIGNNYCGVTNSLKRRRHNHKYNGKQNTDKIYVLDAYRDRAKALETEAKFHAEGYHGAYQRDNCELTRDLEKGFKLTLN